MKLFFDTETTGLADFKLKPWDAGQPRLVQLAAIITEDDGPEISQANLIIKPENFEIPEEATKKHGITTQNAYDYGVSIRSALSVFHYWWQNASLIVCHNTAFDLFIVTGEFHRLLGEKGLEMPLSSNIHCTMKTMTKACSLPGKFQGSYKWPTCSEAFEHVTGKPLEGAHNALVDVRACMEIYWWQQARMAVAA